MGANKSSEPLGASTRTYRGGVLARLFGQMRKDLGADAVAVRHSDGRTRGPRGLFHGRYVEIEAMPPPPDSSQLGRDDPSPPRVKVSARAKPAVVLAARGQAGQESAYVTAYLASLAKLGAQSAMPGGIREAHQPPSPAAPPPWTPPRAAPAPAVERSASAPTAPAPEARPAPGRATAPQPPPRARPPAPPRQPHPEPPRPPAPPRQPQPEPAARRPESAARQPEPAAGAPAAPAAVLRSVERARGAIERSLTRRGVSEALAREVLDSAAAHVLPLAPRAGLTQAVREALAQRIPVAAPLAASGGALAVVGVGGAGKTTLCGSLLAAYRDGSTLPARYAAILRGAEEPGELSLMLAPELLRPVPADSPRARRALRRAREQGLLVIDTPATSPADRRSVRELARLFSELEPERVLIALPATIGAAAAEQLLAGLAPLGAGAIALSHADETDQAGVGVEAACRFGLAPELILERGASGGWRLSRLDPSAVARRLLD